MKIPRRPTIQMPHANPRISNKNLSKQAGFTLVEMLAVVAIIMIMMALIAPAIGNFGSTAGRKGAVNILMNTMEQARVAAIESGREVHVVFWRREFPDRDAIMVVRETEDGTGTYEQMTRWVQLPKGVLLYDGKNKNLLSPTDLGGLDTQRLPMAANDGKVNLLTFNSFGGVQYPGRENLMLLISEGVRGAGGTEAIIADKKQSAGGFEIITLRRYTGRASLEVSTIDT